jgi:hypothetical protein
VDRKPSLKPPHPANRSIKVYLSEVMSKLAPYKVGKDTKKTCSTESSKSNLEEKSYFAKVSEIGEKVRYPLARSSPS